MNRFMGRRSALVTALATMAMPVLAQSTPVGKVIVPYSSGGTSDWLARLTVQKLNDKWQTSYIVENRPGGDTQIGTLAVARAKPDGQTILFTSVSLASVNKYSAPAIAYDAQRDLIPAALVAKGPTLLLVNPGLGVSNFAEFVRLARSQEGRLTFSTASSTGVYFGDIFMTTVGVKTVAVPYKGSAPAVLAVATGEVSYTWESIPSAKGLVDADRVKVLLTTADQRLDQFPNVPTANEAGYPQLNAIGGWWGMFVPAGTPAAFTSRLNAAVNEILSAEDVKKHMRDRGVFSTQESTADFAGFMSAEYERHLLASKQMVR